MRLNESLWALVVAMIGLISVGVDEAPTRRGDALRLVQKRTDKAAQAACCMRALVSEDDAAGIRDLVRAIDELRQDLDGCRKQAERSAETTAFPCVGVERG